MTAAAASPANVWQPRGRAGQNGYPQRSLDSLARILERASQGHLSAFDRVGALSRFGVRLDNLFRTRVAPMTDDSRRGQLDEVLHALSAEHERVLHEIVVPGLVDEGALFPRWDELDEPDQQSLHRRFRDRIYPLVTPLAVNATHPFPFVAAGTLNLGALVSDPDGAQERFACVRIPERLPRYLRIDPVRRIGVETLTAAMLPDLFHGIGITEQVSFRVSRSAHVEPDAEPVRELLRTAGRGRAGAPVRLDVEETASDEVIAVLTRYLGLDVRDVYRLRAPLGTSAMVSAVRRARRRRSSNRIGSRIAVVTTAGDTRDVTPNPSGVMCTDGCTSDSSITVGRSGL